MKIDYLVTIDNIKQIVTVPGLINVDFADVRNVMKDKGTALMGIGIASGPNRAVEAARKAIRSPLLEIDINGATDAIVFITSDVDIAMQEVLDVMEEIRNASTQEINIICGTGFNIELQGELIVTVIATGFDTPKDEEKKAPFLATSTGKVVTPADPSRKDATLAGNPQAKEEKVLRDKENPTLPSWLSNRFK